MVSSRGVDVSRQLHAIWLTVEELMRHRNHWAAPAAIFFIKLAGRAEQPHWKTVVFFQKKKKVYLVDCLKSKCSRTMIIIRFFGPFGFGVICCSVLVLSGICDASHRKLDVAFMSPSCVQIQPLRGSGRTGNEKGREWGSWGWEERATLTGCIQLRPVWSFERVPATHSLRFRRRDAVSATAALLLIFKRQEDCEEKGGAGWCWWWGVCSPLPLLRGLHVCAGRPLGSFMLKE